MSRRDFVLTDSNYFCIITTMKYVYNDFLSAMSLYNILCNVTCTKNKQRTLCKIYDFVCGSSIDYLQ